MAQLIKIAEWAGAKRGSVVFVHGLTGHPYKTWMHGSDLSTLWPRWLARDVKGLSVYSVGYDAPFWQLDDCGTPLLAMYAEISEMLRDEPGLQSGPITFVCHSLGGLVVKKVLRDANERRRDERLTDLLHRTKAVVFLATPHAGARQASMVEKLGFAFLPSEAMKDLVADNAVLDDLNIGYREVAQQLSGSLTHVVYREGRPFVLPILGWTVAPSSADPGLVNCHPVTLGEEDHTTICKPKNEKARVYEKVMEIAAAMAPEPAEPGRLLTVDPLPTYRKEWTKARITRTFARAVFSVPFVALVLLALWWLGLIGSPNGQTACLSSRPQILASRHITTAKNYIESARNAEKSKSWDAARTNWLEALTSAGKICPSTNHEADQSFIFASQALAALALRDRKHVEAADYYELSFQRDPKHNWLALIKIGELKIISDPAGARDAYNKASDILLSKLIDSPDDKSLMSSYAETRVKLAGLQTYGREFPAALATLGDAIDKLRRIAARIDSNSTDRKNLLEARYLLGDIYREQKQWKDAIRIFSEIVDETKSEFEADPQNDRLQARLFDAYSAVGTVLKSDNQLDVALRTFETAFALAKSTFEKAPGQPQSLKLFALAHENLAIVQRNLNRLGEARQHQAESVKLTRGLVELDPEVELYKDFLSIALEKLGTILVQLDEVDEGLTAYGEAVSIGERRAIDSPDSPGIQGSLAILHTTIGETITAARPCAAIDHFEKSIKIRVLLDTKAPEKNKQRDKIIRLHISIGELALKCRQGAEAKFAAKGALTKARDMLVVWSRESPDDLGIRQRLERVHQRLKELG